MESEGSLPRSQELSACTYTFLRSMHWLLVTASVPSTPVLVALIKEALSSPETSVLTRATWRNFPEDAILQLVCSSSSKLAFPCAKRLYHLNTVLWPEAYSP
jgi:hypothetical protein